MVTGLPNRNRFLETIEVEVFAQRPFTIIIISINGFSDLNDTLGSQVGDAFLQSASIRLAHKITSDTFISRTKKNEFTVLIRNSIHINDAVNFAESINKIFADYFTVSTHILTLSASIGISISPTHGTDAEELLARADLALHLAKSNKAKNIQIYDHSMSAEVNARRALRDELLSGYRNGELVLYYQPQVHFRTGRIFGVEALLRWAHPQRGLLPPGKFLPELEQSALAVEVGWWILDEACKTAALIKEEFSSEVKMGVNLFAAQLSAPILCEKVQESLARHGLEAGLLELEVTETIALEQIRLTPGHIRPPRNSVCTLRA